MKCKLKLFHCRWNTLQSCLQPSGRQEEIWLPWVEPGRQTPECCFTLLLASDLILHNLFQNNVLSVNALCLCSAVGILSWPEKMRGWTATVAFSCFHPFGRGEKLLLKSRKDWYLSEAPLTVYWSLHLAVTTVWSSPKPLDKSSSQVPFQKWHGEWVNCTISE